MEIKVNSIMEEFIKKGINSKKIKKSIEGIEEIINPNFINMNGLIILKQLELSKKKYSDLLNYYNNDYSMIEYNLNEINLGHSFDNDNLYFQVKLGILLLSNWACRLMYDFPDDSFILLLSCEFGEYSGCNIRFYKKRKGKDIIDSNLNNYKFNGIYLIEI